jgi:hypothetical protein
VVLGRPGVCVPLSRSDTVVHTQVHTAAPVLEYLVIGFHVNARPTCPLLIFEVLVVLIDGHEVPVVVVNGARCACCLKF